MPVHRRLEANVLGARMVRRRDLLVLGGAIAAVYGLRALPWDKLPGAGPDYAEIPGLAPFRRLETATALSASGPAIIGLDPPDPALAARQARMAFVRAGLCAALFDGPATSASLPVAYFTDVQCAACRALERDLWPIIETAGRSMRLIQHELPIFGPVSDFAARASIAAGFQGRRREMHQHFVRRPIIPSTAGLATIAEEMGLDAERLQRDLTSPEVQDQLDRSRAIADLLGFVGTPALVIGRTAILGAPGISVLNRVISDEMTLSPVVC